MVGTSRSTVKIGNNNNIENEGPFKGLDPQNKADLDDVLTLFPMNPEGLIVAGPYEGNKWGLNEKGELEIVEGPLIGKGLRSPIGRERDWLNQDYRSTIYFRRENSVDRDYSDSNARFL